MNSIMEFFNNNGLSFLMDNKFGLYLPMTISIIIFIFADKKALFSKENLIMFAMALVGCFLLSAGIETEATRMVGDNEITITFNQVHIVNVFAIIYILFFVKAENKERKYNFAALWIFSFLTLWLVDGYHATFHYDKGFFDAGVGGAGILDGLLLDPLLACTMCFILQKIKENRPAKKLTTA